MSAELKQYIDNRFDRLETATLLSAKQILDIREAAMITGFSVKGIYTMTSQKRIPYYKKNGKLYFKKSELEAWMTENRVMTEKEINSKAATYTALHKQKKQSSK